MPEEAVSTKLLRTGIVASLKVTSIRHFQTDTRAACMGVLIREKAHSGVSPAGAAKNVARGIVMKEMRRQDRKLESEEISEILKSGEYGVLATVTDDGRPYSIPLSYAFDERSHVIFMHCSADGGQKIDNLRLHPDACFTVVGQTELLPAKFATRYWSANVFGTVAIIDEAPEKQKGIEAILRKYSPEYVEKGLRYIEGAIQKIYILRLEIHESTGKATKM